MKGALIRVQEPVPVLGGTCTVNPNKLTPFIFKKNNLILTYLLSTIQ